MVRAAQRRRDGALVPTHACSYGGHIQLVISPCSRFPWHGAGGNGAAGGARHSSSRGPYALGLDQTAAVSHRWCSTPAPRQPVERSRPADLAYSQAAASQPVVLSARPRRPLPSPTRPNYQLPSLLGVSSRTCRSGQPLRCATNSAHPSSCAKALRRPLPSRSSRYRCLFASFDIVALARPLLPRAGDQSFRVIRARLRHVLRHRVAGALGVSAAEAGVRTRFGGRRTAALVRPPWSPNGRPGSAYVWGPQLSFNPGPTWSNPLVGPGLP